MSAAEDSGAPAEPAGGARLPRASLEFVGHADIGLGEPFEVGELATGRRRVIPVAGGTLEGPRLRGTILAEGSDWQLVWRDGTAVIDTRYLLRTEGGALVTIQTRGFRHGPADVIDRLSAGEPVDPSQYYFRVAVALETAAAEHAWVNRAVFVAVAARSPGAVSYDLYSLA